MRYALAIAALTLAVLPAGPASASLLSLNQPVSCSGYYNAGSEVFPCANVDNGATGDTGSAYNWSFWLSPQGTTAGQYVTIDLGAVDAINQIVVQDTHNRNYHDRGTQDFTIDVSSNGTSFTNIVSSAFTTADWNNLTNLTFNVAASGRYVRFTAVNPNPCFGCGSVGLNEMSVFGSQATSTPEPAAILLLAPGIAGLALLRRRRG